MERNPGKRLEYLGWGLHGLGLTVVMATAALGYALVLGPLAARTVASHQRAAYLEERLQDADGLRAQYERMERSAAALDREVAELEKRVPREPLEAEFLSQLAAAAGEAGLKIGDYRPGVIRTRKGHSALEIQLSCQGSYPNLCRFLDRVAAAGRLSQITQVEIKPQGGSGCRATLTLVIFFRPATPGKQGAGTSEGGLSHG